MQAWIEEMSEHIKSQDPHHMVTVGAEGFFGPGSNFQWFNPSNPHWVHESSVYKPPSGTSR
jgi:endo-1,4-beta-mannosidase